MTSCTAIFIVIVTGLLAAVATLFVHRLVTAELRREHHEVGSTVFLQLGVVFAVLLAFVFSEAWGQYNAASAAIDLEVGALHGASMIAATLPTPAAKEILTKELAYIDSVVHTEWTVMAVHRTEDIVADQKLRDLIQAAARLKLDEPEKKSEILSLLAQAHGQLEVRIYQVSNGIPLALWIVLIGIGFVLTLFVFFSGLRYRASAVLVSAVFASAVSSILVVIQLLDFPFEGALALSPKDFYELVSKIGGLIAGLG